MTVLTTLLDAGARFDAEYADGLSNHLPMALVALQAMGAPDARLEAFAAGYAPRLRPAPAAVPWPAGDAWSSQFGAPGAWSAYRSLFAEWLMHEGRDAVLAQVLPVLMTGCGAAAFHGLLRTAYAVASGHDGELVSGLAHWAHRHLPLEAGFSAPALGAGFSAPPLGAEPAAEPDLDDPVAALNELRAVFWGQPVAGRLIVDRMRATAARPGFAAHVRRLRIDADTLPDLARRATAAYADAGDFSVLHLVTACHAMRVLLPLVDDPEPAVRSFWFAYAAAAAGLPASAFDPRPLAEPMPDWPEIVARAIRSDDEHLIKLVYSAGEQARRDDEFDLGRRAAARAVEGAAARG